MKSKAERVELDTDAFFEQLREKHPDKADAMNFVASREKSNKKHNSNVQTTSEALALAKEAAKAAGTKFDTDAFFEQFREKHPDKAGAMNFVAGSYSVLSKRKRMLTSVSTSVKNEAKARKVKECEIACSIYKCAECSEKRSKEYTSFHYAVAADHDGNKQMTCLLCQEQNSIRSGCFRPVGSILFKVVRDERLKLDELSKQEKKSKKSKSKKSNSKKSAPKRKVEVVTSRKSLVEQGRGWASDLCEELKVKPPAKKKVKIAQHEEDGDE
jgi:uncharacterized short protein YbdD (DUF466 family)